MTTATLTAEFTEQEYLSAAAWLDRCPQLRVIGGPMRGFQVVSASCRWCEPQATRGLAIVAAWRGYGDCIG